MLCAYTVILAMHISLHLQIKNGMGMPPDYALAHPELEVTARKVGYSENVFYQASLGLIKAGILLQYLTIATTPLQRRCVLGLLCFVILFCSFTTLSAVLLCIPVTNAWNMKVFPEGCWNTATVNTVSTSVNMSTDIAIYALPIPILIKLRLPTRKKFGLVGVFSIAFLAIGASIGRLTSLGTWNHTQDFVRSSMIPLWGAIEADSAMIAVSLPLLKPLFVLLRDNIASMHSQRSRRKSSTTMVGSDQNNHKAMNGSADEKSIEKKSPDPYNAGSVVLTSMIELEDDRYPEPHGDRVV
jgi:hypothetical protein